MRTRSHACIEPALLMLRVAKVSRGRGRASDRKKGPMAMGFIADSLNRIQPSATIAVSTKARQLAGSGPRHHLAVRRRARLRHARERQGRPRQGAGRGQDQVHRRRRHPRAQGGDRAQVQARERPRLQARQDLGRHRRQAGHLQCAAGDAQPRRRGGDPGAVLGLLCRHRHARRRQARICRDAARGRLPPERARPRGGDHAEDQVADLQLAVEPDGRGLHQGADQGADGCAAAPSARLGAERRHLRAPASTTA